MMQFGQDASALDGLAPSKVYEHRLHIIQVEATALIVRNIDLGSSVDSDLLLSLIEHFDTQARQVPAPAVDDFSESSLVLVRTFDILKP
jgi:hypothetical protein